MKLDLYAREHERLGKYSEKVSTIKKFRNVFDESNLLKKQLLEKDQKIEELKVEIKKLNIEIESYKKEKQKNTNKEKDYIKENNQLKNYLNQKERIIKDSKNKLNEINIKLNDEKSKNQKLIVEVKELHLKLQIVCSILSTYVLYVVLYMLFIFSNKLFFCKISIMKTFLINMPKISDK